MSSKPMQLWLAATLPGLLFMIGTARGPFAQQLWVSPLFLFWFVVIVASLCAIGSVVVLLLGWHRRLVEIAILGAGLFMLSTLSLVHGLTTPGVLFSANSATMASAFLAGPAALIVAGPVLLPNGALSRAFARAWQPWVVVTVSAACSLAGMMLVLPNAVPAPQMGSALAMSAMFVSFAGYLAVALRQMRLYRIGHRPASLFASVGFINIGASTIVWATQEPFSPAFWGAHILDAVGVFAAIIGLGLAHGRDRSLAGILAPVVNRDPLAALELGLTPTVHNFIAALERKDPITREHVVRVGELAMRVGLRAGLEPERLRALGLGALLHDVGKLNVPDEILNKQDRLTEAEFEEIKRHTLIGEQLMRTSHLLEPAADLVRWHHERADGSGYPDGLLAGELPLEVAIVSVCDAWDAMTFSRQYRSALSEQLASEILREGAGSQWSTEAVDLVLAELKLGGQIETPRFSWVGRESGDRDELAAVCCDAIPDVARVRLAQQV